MWVLRNLCGDGPGYAHGRLREEYEPSHPLPRSPRHRASGAARARRRGHVAAARRLGRVRRRGVSPSGVRREVHVNIKQKEKEIDDAVEKKIAQRKPKKSKLKYDLSALQNTDSAAAASASFPHG